MANKASTGTENKRASSYANITLILWVTSLVLGIVLNVMLNTVAAGHLPHRTKRLSNFPLLFILLKRRREPQY